MDEGNQTTVAPCTSLVKVSLPRKVVRIEAITNHSLTSALSANGSVSSSGVRLRARRRPPALRRLVDLGAQPFL